MADRIGIGRLPEPKVVRPTAQPVDTFVAPQRDTGVEQLTAALGELVPSLRRFGGVLGEQKAAKEKQEGEARARQMAAEGKSFADAVKSGAIRKDENPWFRVGFYEASGRVAGMKYVGDFLEALGKSDVSESVELEDFDQFEQEFRAEWVKNQFGEKVDPFLTNAFGTTADGQIAGFRNEFARAAGDRMVRANDETFHAEIFELAQMFSETDLSASERAAGIRIAQDRQVVTGGMTYEQVNRLTAQAIGMAAVRMEDASLLDILDQIPTSAQSKGFLGGTSYGAKIREEAEGLIGQAMDARVRREEVRDKKEKEAKISTITGGMLDALAADPGADISLFTREMREVDPAKVQSLVNIRDTVAGGVYADDPETVRELTIGIQSRAPGSFGYTTLRDLDNAFTNKDLTFDTYRTLRSDLEKRDTQGGAGAYSRNPILTDIASETYKVFVAEFREDTPAVRHNAQQAADEAEYQMLLWLQKNPDASPADILTAKTDIRNRAVVRRSGIQTETDESGTGITVPQIPPARFYLADPLAAAQLQRELEEIVAGARGGFSGNILETLRKNGIDNTKLGDVQEFVREQMEWTNSPTLKP